MNSCCKKTAQRLLGKLANNVGEGKTEESSGCNRCGAYITAKVEGMN